MSEKNSADLLAVERHLQHHIAHEMQNAVGAVTLYLEMLIEDVTDPNLRARLEKVARANRMTDNLIQALRYAIPRGDGLALSLNPSMMLHVIRHMFGTLGEQITLDEGVNDTLSLGGAPAILFDCLYKLINFMLAANPSARFVIKMTPIQVQKTLRLHIAPMPGLDLNTLDRARLSLSADAIEYPGLTQGGGAVLIWPLA